ncbi:MAG: ATP-binding cassette domain-containing protein [Candidatus Faecisoma sp.]|nr:ATP-binding cassette domain-containing protein [Acholeplasma sp.]MDY2893197.1 ATP-binding cassette domain-containing protein [Candidatus Faecisoma sp.]
MLEIRNIKKSYKTGTFIQHALKDVSISFRPNEFVAILGPSGSGKTTLLNIIGGLDRYDSGDLVINGKSTKKFSDSNWDSYRNNCVGFIFQSYNLINHLNILENVEMSLTLSGVSKKVRKQKALDALKQVGLINHAYKKPNQLSGGQMQRVAIARALVNEPDIILADEPTGALDSTTSVQIMELIKEIAKDKLVIMVTHNKELAYDYANRIIELKDGELINDTNPHEQSKNNQEYKIRKTAMSFFTALSLSFKNIETKKGRTFLTAFASSIGIIGIALILSLSNGFNIEVEKFEKDALSSLPIMISEQTVEMDEDSLAKMRDSFKIDNNSYPSEEVIYIQKDMVEDTTHTNIINQEFIDYIEKINPKYVSGISYMRLVSINALSKAKDGYKIIDNSYLTTLPKSLDEKQNDVVEDNYDLLKGKFATNKDEVVLAIDSKNRVNEKLLEMLGFDLSKDNFTFDEILNKEIKVVLNDDWYIDNNNYFIPNFNYEELYNNKNNLTLKIVGIIRGKEDAKLVSASSGIAYTESLIDYIVENNSKSKIVLKQKEVDYNILTGEQFREEKDKDAVLSYLGNDNLPILVNIFPRNFDSKDEIIKYLDDYNETKLEEDKLLYTDMASLISSLSGSIMDAITIVLIAFSSISLVVSCIMIGIITYISVLERTKEIGILRAMGARRKDITRVFNAETIIIGLCSGLLGITIARILVFPANIIIYNATGLDNVAKMNPLHALLLLIISMLLTVLGGLIPAKVASRKNPVEALRTE